MFLRYVIKVDKREVLRLYFERIDVLLLFLVFPAKLKSVQSALSDLKRPPERLQSQCNYRSFIT